MPIVFLIGSTKITCIPAAIDQILQEYWYTLYRNTDFIWCIGLMGAVFQGHTSTLGRWLSRWSADSPNDISSLRCSWRIRYLSSHPQLLHHFSSLWWPFSAHHYLLCDWVDTKCKSRLSVMFCIKDPLHQPPILKSCLTREVLLHSLRGSAYGNCRIWPCRNPGPSFAACSLLF